jgi:hypothetical protein
MNTFNLEQVVDFSTIIFKDKVTQLDHICLNKGKYNYISVHPVNNGLSDHEVQFLVLDKTLTFTHTMPQKQKIRHINYQTITNFQALLRE